MNEDKKWMLMTYYCPTHGDAGKVEPIQVTRQEISNNLYEKTESKKGNIITWNFKKTGKQDITGVSINTINKV